MEGDRCAEYLRGNLDPDKLAEQNYIAVPAPPSKRRDDPEYDDRMIQVVQKFCDGSNLECRELLLTTKNRQAAHASEARRDQEELRKTLKVNPACAKPAPGGVLLFDDVLTTGCTFKACEAVLQEAYPGIPVLGIFIARRAIPRDPDEEVDIEDAL